jgi:hypothetical protein
MHIKKCKLLDGSIHEYHSATNDFDLGDCSQLDFNYLGQGIIYSIDGVLQPECTTERFHFWEKTRNKKEDRWATIREWFRCHSALTTIIYDDPYD